MSKISKLLLGILLITCCGCYKVDSYENDVISRLEVVNKLPVYKQNHHSKYFDYYLSRDVGCLDKGVISDVFNYNGTKFVMNIDVNYIVSNTREYSDNALYTIDGTYTNNEYKEKKYKILVYEYGSEYYVCMYTDTCVFTTLCSPLKSMKVLEKMLYMARSVSINETRIKDIYKKSNDIYKYNYKNDFFDTTVPESGNVNELFQSEKYRNIYVNEE